MLKRFLVLVSCLIVSAMGESPARLDMSSEESYRASLHAMKAQMTDEEQERLDFALAMLRQSAMGPDTLSALLHGRTAQQVFELAPVDLAEVNAEELEALQSALAEMFARGADALLELRIAEKRASIDATDDPVLKERRRSELQSLLKWRDDHGARTSPRRFSSGSYVPPGDPLSTRPVPVSLGDQTYDIPRNFVSRIAWKGTEDNHQHVVLHALWPGMEPRSESNEREWHYYDDAGVRVADWNAEREITITLAPPGFRASDGYGRFQNAFRVVAPVIGEQRYGLTPHLKRHPQFPTTYHVAHSTAYRTPQDTPVVVECQDASRGIMELFRVKMRCDTTYVLEDGVGLHYRFYTTDLKGWKERDIAVRELVKSFRSMR
jgi:hypothetical protein